MMHLFVYREKQPRHPIGIHIASHSVYTLSFVYFIVEWYLYIEASLKLILVTHMHILNKVECFGAERWQTARLCIFTNQVFP